MKNKNQALYAQFQLNELGRQVGEEADVYIKKLVKSLSAKYSDVDLRHMELMCSKSLSINFMLVNMKRFADS